MIYANVWTKKEPGITNYLAFQVLLFSSFISHGAIGD